MRKSVPGRSCLRDWSRLFTSDSHLMACRHVLVTSDDPLQRVMGVEVIGEKKVVKVGKKAGEKWSL